MKMVFKLPRDYKADEICAAEGLLMLSRLSNPITPAEAAAAPPPPAAVEKIEDGSAALASESPHKCDVCGASFKSYYALGGHKTLHRPKSTAAASLAVPGGGNDRVHECSQCPMRFSTGQALGGHKRKHFLGTIGGGGGGAKCKSGETSSGGSPARGSSGSVTTEVIDQNGDGDASRAKVLLFDLNMPYFE